ncbi:hypothetical protein M569_02861 [Genlisea aurea]|uniref:MI domain-containing protein n=1 Tax=Genlisea aurea TaxID=192259 RepID=S8CY39_9LAMI|nr:hypothetical protein M569_02861 [Genlisea aurea]
MGGKRRYDSSSSSEDVNRGSRRHNESRRKSRDSDSEEFEKEAARKDEGRRKENPDRVRYSEEDSRLNDESKSDRHRKSRRDDNKHDDYDRVEHRRRRDYGGELDEESDRIRNSESRRQDGSHRREPHRDDGHKKENYRDRDEKNREYDTEGRRDRDHERAAHRRNDLNGDKDSTRENSKAEDAKRESKENDSSNTKQPQVNATPDANLGRSGGIYIPPYKLARMMKEIEDKSSVEYQRMTWDALRKSINGLVNKVNATNIKNIIPELFAENLIRGRGLFCRSCMKSQMASPGFTDVFAALVAVVNTKFPEIGDLLLRRIILQLQRAYKRNDKPQLLAAVKFIAHLVNQQVAHEIIALELLTLLLDKPTDDSVEVAVGFVTECGAILRDLSPRGLDGIFERLRGILHEGEIDMRVQFLIESLFGLRRAKFQDHPAVRPQLDLVDEEDQLTHEFSLLDKIDPEIALDVFKPDPQFTENEKRYDELKKQMLGEEDSDDDDDADSDPDEDSDEEGGGSDESEGEDEEQMKIMDETETNLINLRRTIYLTIMSSATFEEAGHKLLSIKLEPGQEMELCTMLLECCSQERTYLRFYGLLGGTLCMKKRVYQENFDTCFVQQYSMIHRLETNKLRNVAKFFGHLLGTDKLPWHVLSYIRLTEEDTTSSSRIFIKILFQEMSEHLGIRELNERLSDGTMQESFESIFPRDNPKNTRFSINFFTSIGLGGITENLREYLKNMPRLMMQQQMAAGAGGDGSGESTSGDESDSDGGTESSQDERRKKRRR